MFRDQTRFRLDREQHVMYTALAHANRERAVMNKTKPDPCASDRGYHQTFTTIGIRTTLNEDTYGIESNVSNRLAERPRLQTIQSIQYSQRLKNVSNPPTRVKDKTIKEIKNKIHQFELVSSLMLYCV